MGIGGVLIVLVLSWATGTDLTQFLGSDPGVQVDPTTTESRPPTNTTPQEERMVDMVDAVAADAQATWASLMDRYERTKVVLFRGATQTGCGPADSSTGPFYCPADHLVYLDLSFFDELSRRFGAPGEFAQAYVVAHEFGHHVQNLLGADERARQGARQGANSASVALELQADCYAGVWGHAASSGGRVKAGRVSLEPGDMEAALRAAAAIGDDRLQKQAGGRINPERFTHGTSEQRMQWFKRGMDTGDPNGCDTFGRTTQ